ncbi:hypothetical protein BH09ACT8_BH09ACT8_38990 [soil metagenome]
MTKSAVNGPLITLAAAAALGIGVFSANLAQEDPSATPERPAASVVTTTVKAVPATPTTPTPSPFPEKAAFHGDIPNRKGVLTVDIKVTGARATAYVCDNYDIEEWLAGSAVDGVVSLQSDDGESRLDGRHQANNTIVGNLSVGDKPWTYTATAVHGQNNV